MIVFCVGMKRSGSTLQYNIAYRLLKDHYPETETLGFKTKEELIPLLQDKQRRKNLKTRYQVVKSHDLPFENIQGTTEQFKYLYIHRDIFEVARSIKTKFKNSDTQLIDALEEAIDIERKISKMDNTLTQDYSSSTNDLEKMIEEIAKYLELKLTKQSLASYAKEFNVVNVKKNTANQSSNILSPFKNFLIRSNKKMTRLRRIYKIIIPEKITNKLRKFAYSYDSDTLFHPGHITNSATNLECLSIEEITEINKRFEWWQKIHGYSISSN